MGRYAVPAGNDHYRKIVRENGEYFGKSVTHQSLGDYRKAVGLATGHQFAGGAMHEYSYSKDGRHAIRVGGREFLGTVDLPTDAGGAVLPLPMGGSFVSTTQPMSPLALGGRLTATARLYEQHKLISCRIRYEPDVPTIANGSLALTFANDVSVEDLRVGRDAVNEAASRSSFEQTSVWEEAYMDIRPQDAQLRYFDNPGADFRTEVQGLVRVIATSDFPAAYSVAGAPVTTLGNLYLEYDYDFFSPDLSTTLMDTPNITLNCAMALAENPPARSFIVGAIGSAFTNYLITTIEGTVTGQDLVGYLLVGTIIYDSGDLIGQRGFLLPEHPEPFSWETGQTIFARFAINPSGDTPIVSFYSNMADAGNQSGITESVFDDPEPGILMWPAGAIASAGPNVFRISGTLVPIADRT